LRLLEAIEVCLFWRQHIIQYGGSIRGIVVIERRPSSRQIAMELCARDLVRSAPIVYKDFVPASTAEIFQSNLGANAQKNYAAHSSRGSRQRPVHRFAMSWSLRGAEKDSLCRAKPAIACG
jgi:uncharacterized glyoxalase superfamily metalloenzyme YdcJ